MSTDRDLLTKNYVIQYDKLAERRASSDTLLWQAPLLSMTAQAFLMQIALGREAEFLSILCSTTLSIVASAASIHTMVKHRLFEVSDSQYLYELEKKYSLWEFHKQPPPNRIGKSFHAWLRALTCFGMVSFVILSLAVFQKLLKTGTEPCDLIFPVGLGLTAAGIFAVWVHRLKRELERTLALNNYREISEPRNEEPEDTLRTGQIE